MSNTKNRELSRYRDWVTDHRLAAAALAGIIATHMATIIGFWMPSIGLPELNWPLANGAVYMAHSSMNVQFLSGSIFHYIDGMIFTIMFVIALRPLLPFAMTPGGNMISGLLLGTVLATIALGFMTPLVYLPHAHVGFFSHNLGWKYIVAVYLWHWVYGLHVGVVYNPREAREVSTESVSS